MTTTYAKQSAYRSRLDNAGKCPHCGKPCAPYAECEERRRYKRKPASRTNKTGPRKRRVTISAADQSNEQLADCISRGDESAYPELLERMKGMLWQAVRKYGRLLDEDGKEEMFQEAQIIMLVSARKFDVSRGFKFSTYLGSRLRNIIQACSTYRLIRVPNPNGREKTKQRQLLDFSRMNQPVSFQYVADGDHRFDVAASDNGHSDAADGDHRHRQLHSFINQLPERERAVMRMRAVGMTLKECGEIMGMSKERVRQLQLRAMEKLKRWAAGESEGYEITR